MKVGNKVKLLPENYHPSPHNPLNTRGVVTEVLNRRLGRTVRVKWDNGNCNIYYPNELKVCSTKLEFRWT